MITDEEFRTRIRELPVDRTAQGLTINYADLAGWLLDTFWPQRDSLPSEMREKLEEEICVRVAVEVPVAAKSVLKLIACKIADEGMIEAVGNQADVAEVRAMRRGLAKALRADAERFLSRMFPAPKGRPPRTEDEWIALGDTIEREIAQIRTSGLSDDDAIYELSSRKRWLDGTGDYSYSQIKNIRNTAAEVRRKRDA